VEFVEPSYQLSYYGQCLLCGNIRKLIHYHVNYSPGFIVYACEPCNYLEFAERHKMIWHYIFQPIIISNIRKLRRTKFYD